jgi:hypothetical protein
MRHLMREDSTVQQRNTSLSRPTSRHHHETSHRDRSISKSKILPAAQSNGTAAGDTQKPSSAETIVDGRDFFRRAKSILSYDQFTALLSNVKAYNTREQSRVRTLQNVYDGVAESHPQMYTEFEKLLTR